MKTNKMRCIEFDRGRTIEQMLQDGVERGWTDAEIAKDLGISVPTFYDWLEVLGAEIVRTRSITFEREPVAV